MSLADATGSFLSNTVIDDVCRHKVDDDVMKNRRKWTVLLN